MNHDERLALIYRPFVITTYRPAYRWGGCSTRGGNDPLNDLVRRIQVDWSEDDDIDADKEGRQGSKRARAKKTDSANAVGRELRREAA